MKAASFLLLLSLSFAACREKGPVNRKPIRLGDSALIVTEYDSQYLQNFTGDISPVKKASSERQIAEMMVQVDSAKTSRKLEAEAATPVRGFAIRFAECTVTFNGLLAHALKETQDERTLNSVAYLKDGGEFLEMNLQVEGLSEVKVEQRLSTRLFVQHDGETLLLDEPGRFLTPWYNLAGRENRFVSVGSNSLAFHPVDQKKISQSLSRALKKKRKDATETAAWMKAIASVKTYTDPPCVLRAVSAQWRITGRANGRRVQKLIQFDEPLP